MTEPRTSRSVSVSVSDAKLHKAITLAGVEPSAVTWTGNPSHRLHVRIERAPDHWTQRTIYSSDDVDGIARVLRDMQQELHEDD